MTADRITVSLDKDLGRSVRDAAEREGISVSSWLSQAAVRKLRNELLGVALGHWFDEIGQPTDAEMRATAERLGLDADEFAAAATEKQSAA